MGCFISRPRILASSYAFALFFVLSESVDIIVACIMALSRWVAFGLRVLRGSYDTEVGLGAI